MTVYEIPLTPEPQRFSIDMAGVEHQVRVFWCAAAAVWCIDVSNDQGFSVLGIPLVTGRDLFEPYAYLNPPGKLYAQTERDTTTPPGLTTLGTTAHVYLEV